MRNTIVHYLVVFLITIFSVGAIDFFTTNTGLLTIFSVIMAVAVYYRCKPDKIYMYIMSTYLLVSLLHMIIFGDIRTFPFIGFFLRLHIAYFSIRIVKERFFAYFENIVFFFTLFSIPFFIIQLYYPSLLNIFHPVSAYLSTSKRLDAGHIYFIIFNYNSWAPTRNSGFAWEPGGFGFCLVLAILFHLIRNKMQLTFRFYLFLTAAITTLSTTTYIAIFTIFIFYFLNKTRSLYIYVLIPFFALVASEIWQLPFMKAKIDKYVVSIDDQLGNMYGFTYTEQNLTRFSGFIRDMNDLARNPLGYGPFLEKQSQSLLRKIHSANGLSRFFVAWGITGVFIYFLSIIRLSKLLANIFFPELTGKIFIPAIISIIVFSNPLDREPLFITILLFPFVIKQLTKYENKY